MREKKPASSTACKATSGFSAITFPSKLATNLPTT